MVYGILREIFAELKKRIDSAQQDRITSFHLTRYFTTVEISSEAVGAGMSYYSLLPDSVLTAAEHSMSGLIGLNPFDAFSEIGKDTGLTHVIQDAAARAYITTSLCVSIASALSFSFLRDGGDETFLVTSEAPRHWFAGIERALVIGFPGYLPALLKEPQIKRLHVSDLHYESSRRRIDDVISFYRTKYVGKHITAGPGIESRNEFQQYDLITITGSALCNGTLDGLLDNINGNATIILQGQSASLHPSAMFRAGVNGVVTTLKPRIINTLASRDYSGNVLRGILEGNLPWIYLEPRTSRSDLTQVHGSVSVMR